MEYLKHLSPVASQHLNISGLYEFTEMIAHINVDSLVAVLLKILEEAVNLSVFAKKKE